jgi:DNA polymerase-1
VTKHILIDADPFAYRAALSKDNDTIGGVLEKIDELFKGSVEAVKERYGDDLTYKAFLTGPNNFRKELCESYKGNRKAEKPVLLSLAREYILDNYISELSDGEEADDAIAIQATKLYPNAVIVSIDKDFRQVPCKLYNPTRREWSDIEQWEGLLFFYQQLLMGDRADNIVGVWKVGEITSEKILRGVATEQEMWRRCLEAYEGDYDRAVMNGRLLWLRREEGQMWEPPSLGDTDLALKVE